MMPAKHIEKVAKIPERAFELAGRAARPHARGS